MSAYTTETLQDFESINPDIGQVSMPKDLTQAFSNAATVNPDQALDASGLQAENRGREYAAAEGIKEISQSVEILDETIKQVEPEQPESTNLGGRVAAVGASLATGGVATAFVATMAGPVAAAVFAGAGTLSTFKDVAGIARDAFGGGQDGAKNKMENTNEGFKSTGPVENTFEYAAQQRSANMQPFGAARDIKAFKGAARHNAKGFEGIAERAEISEQSLEGIKTLKMKLEDQMVIREKSMENVKDVNAMLNQRAEKGVAVEQTQEVAYANGYKPPENQQQQHMSFNV